MVQAKMTPYGRVITKPIALRMQRADVESRVARFENLQCFDCPWHRAAVLSKEPGLAPFLITA